MKDTTWWSRDKYRGRYNNCKYLCTQHRGTSVHKTNTAAAAAAKSLQSCPTLCNPIDSSPPGSPVPGIFQARTLEWVAMSFSSAWKWRVKVKLLSRVRLFTTPWTTAHQAPPSMGFSRQEYWSGSPLPSPRQTLTDIKGEIDSNTIIVGDFNTPLTPTDKSSKQKINNETQVLNDILDEMDLTDIFRTFHSYVEEYTFFQVHVEHSWG